MSYHKKIYHKNKHIHSVLFYRITSFFTPVICISGGDGTESKLLLGVVEKFIKHISSMSGPGACNTHVYYEHARKLRNVKKKKQRRRQIHNQAIAALKLA